MSERVEGGSGYRGPLIYSRPGHLLNQAPLGLVDQISEAAAFHGYVNDFLRWEGPVAETATAVGGWILSGVTGAATIVVKDSSQFGAIRIANSAVANGNSQLQLDGSSFRYVVGKRLWLLARVALADVNDQLAFVGLGIENNTDFVAGLPSDGLFFDKLETVADWQFQARKGGTSTTKVGATGLTLADDGFHLIGFAVDPVGNVRIYAGTTFGTLAEKIFIAKGDANLPDDQDLTLYIAQETGAGAADYIDVDYVLVAQER